jgi:predicted phosphodiesterase
MLLGLASDIHGDLPSLQAVALEPEREDLDEVVRLGDVERSS